MHRLYTYFNDSYIKTPCLKKLNYRNNLIIQKWDNIFITSFCTFRMDKFKSTLLKNITLKLP